MYGPGRSPNSSPSIIITIFFHIKTIRVVTGALSFPSHHNGGANSALLYS